MSVVTNYTFTLTAHAKARGWQAAFGPGVVAVQIGQSGRGERSRTTMTDISVPARLRLDIELSGAERWLHNATA